MQVEDDDQNVHLKEEHRSISTNNPQEHEVEDLPIEAIQDVLKARN